MSDLFLSSLECTETKKYYLTMVLIQKEWFHMWHQSHVRNVIDICSWALGEGSKWAGFSSTHFHQLILINKSININVIQLIKMSLCQI